MFTTCQNTDGLVRLGRRGAILAAVLVGWLVADSRVACGEIIHTLLEPPHVIPGAPGSLDIDLDNDGNADFALVLSFSNSLTVERCGNGIGIVKEFGFDSSTAKQYLVCESVLSTALFHIGPLDMNGAWVGAENVYLGLRFSIEGHNHLGWARLDVRAFDNSPMLKGYAYNTVPENEPGGETISPGLTTPPTITCPADVNLSCNESTDPVNTGVAVATSFCGPTMSNIFYTDVVADGQCPHTYVITRQWMATDVFDQTSTCDQTITMADTTDPSLTAPGAVTVQCAADVPPAAADLVEFLQLTGATVSDDCSLQANITITWISDTSNGNTCPEIITRTYLAEDECGNTADATQTITVDDTVGPIITSPADLTIQCLADIPTPAIDLAEFLQLASADVTDNCSEQANITITWMGDTSDGNTCPETIARTYRAEDECGNTTDATQTITVDDTIVPIVTAPSDRTVQCLADVSTPAVDLAEFLQLAHADVSDNCTEQANITLTWISDTSDGSTCPEIITRTYRAEDECGNTTDATQTITVDDTVEPTITAPADLAVQCSEDTPTPATDLAEFLQCTGAEVSDNCSERANITVTWLGDMYDEDIHPRIIRRTYRAEDECGNTTDATQTIIVSDTTSPIIISCPKDQTLFADDQCQATVPNVTRDIVVTDDFDTDLTITQQPPAGTRVNLGKTDITVTTSDDCGYETVCVLTLTVEDNTPPVMMSCPLPQTLVADVNGVAELPDLTANVDAVDRCDPDLTTTQEPPAGSTLGVGETAITVTAMDDSGLTTSCRLIVTVQPYSTDGVAPNPIVPSPTPFDFSDIVIQPRLTGPLMQSLCGIPMCGLGFFVVTPIMCLSLFGMKRRFRRRRRTRR